MPAPISPQPTTPTLEIPCVIADLLCGMGSPIGVAGFPKHCQYTGFRCAKQPAGTYETHLTLTTPPGLGDLTKSAHVDTVFAFQWRVV